MRRALLLLIPCLLALGLACSGATSAPPAALTGAHDLQLVRNMLFVTSSDKDELRVLDLEPAGLPLGTREFLPAPDPIEPLSIPVITRPTRLASDITWGARTGLDGKPLALGMEDHDAGAYVYVSRSSGNEVSIISSARDALIEVGRLNAAGPVTATAAWADVANPAGGKSHLYYTTWDGNRSTLWEAQLELPVPAAGYTAQDLASRQHFFASLDGEAVVDLLVIPGSRFRKLNGVPMCADEKKVCVVMATRQMQGRGGRVLLADLDSLQIAEINFGYPIKRLASHAATDVGFFVYDGGVHDRNPLTGSRWDLNGGCDGEDGGCDRRDLTASGGHDLEAGEHIWGLIDEESCGSSGCAGAVAADSISFQPLKDLSGNRMLPIDLGDSLTTGLSLSPDSVLLLPAPLSGSVTPLLEPLSVVGAVAGSAGTVAYFEGSTLQHIDTDPGGPEIISASMVDDAGVTQPYAYGPQWDGGVLLADGAWHSDSIVVTHLGVIPGAFHLPTSDADGNRFPSSGFDFSPRVEAGDRIIAQCNNGTSEVEFQVAAVDPSGFTTVESAAAIAASCPSRVSFDVRAAQGPNQDVVATLFTGYLLRCGPNRTCSSNDRPYFFRPLQYDPQATVFSIKFEDDLLADGGQVPQDTVWTLDINSHYAPFLVAVDPSAVGCGTQYNGEVILDNPRQRTWIASPAANGVIEIDQANAVRGVDTGASVCYR